MPAPPPAPGPARAGSSSPMSSGAGSWTASPDWSSPFSTATGSSSGTPSSAKSGRRESALSLFQIDTGREWRGGQRQVWLLTRELAGAGYPATLVAQPGSPLQEKAEAAGLRVLPVEIKRRRPLPGRLENRPGDAPGVLRPGPFPRRPRGRSRRPGRPPGGGSDPDRLPPGGISPQDEPVFPEQIRRRRCRRRHLRERPRRPRQGRRPGRPDRSHPLGDRFLPLHGEQRTGTSSGASSVSPPTISWSGSSPISIDSKGHGTLIEAARFLKAHLSKIKIVIIGERRPRARAGRAGPRAGGRTTWSSFSVSAMTCPRLLASLDAFVLTSNAEGLGTSIMDAMAGPPSGRGHVGRRHSGSRRRRGDGASDSAPAIPRNWPRRSSSSIPTGTSPERLGNRGFEVVRREILGRGDGLPNRGSL